MPAQSTPTSARATTGPEAPARRAGWLRTLHQWHWISSAIALFGMLMFALTGITLNHAGAIEARPQIETRVVALPAPLLALLREAGADAGAEARALPAEVSGWVASRLGARVADVAAEWSDAEIYLPLPRPGGDAWLRLDLTAAEAEYELTDRGWIAWLNDLHKGRHAGKAWRWFIDLFAAACVLFSLTGLLILQAHAANRPGVWPAVGLGMVVPLLLVLLFIH